jgi:hypothetical protein
MKNILKEKLKKKVESSKPKPVVSYPKDKPTFSVDILEK